MESIWLKIKCCSVFQLDIHVLYNIFAWLPIVWLVRAILLADQNHEIQLLQCNDISLFAKY